MPTILTPSGGDDTPQIQKAVSDAITGVFNNGSVRLGKGTFNITNINAPLWGAEVNIEGDAGTILNVAPGCTGFHFFSNAGLNSPQSKTQVTIRNLNFKTVGGKTAIAFGNEHGQIDSFGTHIVENIITEGFQTAIEVMNSRKITFRDVHARGVETPDSLSLRIISNSSNLATCDLFFENCELSTSGGQGSVARSVHVEIVNGGSAAGLHFSNCWFYHGQKACLFFENKSGAYLGQVYINNCQFDWDGGRAGEAAILVDSPSGIVRDFNVDSNWFCGFYRGIHMLLNPEKENANISIGKNQYWVVMLPIAGQGMRSFSVAHNTFHHCGDGNYVIENSGIFLSRSYFGNVMGNVHVCDRGPSNQSIMKHLVAASNCGNIIVAHNVGHVMVNSAAVNMINCVNSSELSNIQSTTNTSTPVVLTVREQINQLYRELFNREGDPGGLDWWTSRVESGELTVAQVRAEFMNSSEYHQLQQ